MNDTVKTPTVAELRKAGYEVDIFHRRAYRVAYRDPTNGKLVIKTVLNTRETMNVGGPEDNVLHELLPRGGVTEVLVSDTMNNLTFTATATCRDDENYSKRVGVERCLSRIIGLMLVCEYQNKDGFSVRVET